MAVDRNGRIGVGERESGRRPFWYARHQGAVLGPYPSSGVRRFLLLGRLSLDDQVSVDGTRWVPLRNVPEVIPREVRDALEHGSLDGILPARLREDERTGRDRRDSQQGSGEERRQGNERRRAESALEQRHRASREALVQEMRKPRRFPLSGSLVSGILVAAAIGSGLFLGTPERPVDADCTLPAAPGVVWRNCILPGTTVDGGDLRGADLSNTVLREARFAGSELSGADLRYSDLGGADLSYATLAEAELKGASLFNADLSYADFSGADLSFVDLRGANLGGALLQGARLDRAIWIDGSACAPGSVGSCRPL